MEQMSFDPLVFEDNMGLSREEAVKEAIAARRAVIKKFRAEGHMVKPWTLTGQLRQYKSFGVPDGRVRNVYYINIYPKGEKA